MNRIITTGCLFFILSIVGLLGTAMGAETPNAAAPSEPIHLAFAVNVESGPLSDQVFSGLLTYDPGSVVNLTQGRYEVTDFHFDFQGRNYDLSDNYRADPAFGPEFHVSGSSGGQPVVLYGLGGIFVADFTGDIGFNFVGVTPNPGDFVQRSRFSYGIPKADPGEGPSFSVEGHGEVEFAVTTIPEPTTLTLAMFALLPLAGRRRGNR